MFGGHHTNNFHLPAFSRASSYLGTHPLHRDKSRLTKSDSDPDSNSDSDSNRLFPLLDHRKSQERNEGPCDVQYGPAEPGALSIVHKLYKSKGRRGDVLWSSNPPNHGAEIENDETKKCAVIVRYVKSQDSWRMMEADSIVIQSPWLQKALSMILDDYPGVTCNLKRLVFKKPFEPFVHRWTEFLKYMEREGLESVVNEHLGLLHETLKVEIGDKIQEFEDYILNEVATFDSLWMIFQPRRSTWLIRREKKMSRDSGDSLRCLVSIVADVNDS